MTKFIRIADHVYREEYIIKAWIARSPNQLRPTQDRFTIMIETVAPDRGHEITSVVEYSDYYDAQYAFERAFMLEERNNLQPAPMYPNPPTQHTGTVGAGQLRAYPTTNTYNETAQGTAAVDNTFELVGDTAHGIRAIRGAYDADR